MIKSVQIANKLKVYRQKTTIRVHRFLIAALITHRINGLKGGGTRQGAETGGNTHSQGRSGGRFVARKLV